MKDRSFFWLNATQFFGALNDNLFKSLVSFFLIARLISVSGSDSGSSAVMGWTGIFFAIPFLLLLPIAGAMADRFSKRTIVVGAKILEIVVMVWGALALLLPSSWPAYSALMLMAAQSALFGPAKYGIIPELVLEEELSSANGRLVAASYLAIIAGSAMAPPLTDWARPAYAYVGCVCVAVAVLGTLTSLPIRRLAPAAGRERAWTWTPLSILNTLRSIRSDRPLVVTLWMSAFFSMIAAFMQLNLVPFGMKSIGLNETQSGFIFISAALGIGAGSMLAGKLSGRHIEFGIVPLGALLLAGACFGLALDCSTRLAGHAWAALAGMGCGLFIVPLDAFLQWRSPAARRGEIIAANNFLSWIGVLLAGVLILVLQGMLRLPPAQGFAVLGVLTLVLTAWAIRQLPDFLLRFLAMLLTRGIYRIRVLGLDHVPVNGAALLVANHVSWVDALLLLAIQPRRIRFLMHRSVYRRRGLRSIFRLMGVIPIASGEGAHQTTLALAAARKALDDGYLVCVFAEGALTRTGMMRGFRPGFRKIVQGTAHPIIPVYIGGIWGSIFSHYHIAPMLLRPVRWPYPVTICFGPPLPPDTPAHAVRQAVAERSCEFFENRKPTRLSLAQLFVRRARSLFFHEAMTDTTGRRMTYGAALTAAIALSRRIGLRTRAPAVGLLLPPSVGGAVANIAVTLLGRTAVNLNFTVSREALESALRQSGLDCVITAKPMLARLGDALPSLPHRLFLEDLATEITPLRKGLALLQALFLPARRLSHAHGLSPDAVAALIFSSGTTGEPKGVALSHHNIISNCESMGLVLRPGPHECLAVTLPLFHSFGYTCGIWLPLLHGARAAYHPSPFDAQIIGTMVRQHGCTIMFTTPTLLQNYNRRIPPADFEHLRLMVAGAEKLRAPLLEAFRQRFPNVTLVEGYGATELSPVAALSLPDAEVDGVYHAGHKPGSVGQPLPGIASRIIHPDTGALCEPGAAGLLHIKGPNVMTGYWNRPDLTREAVSDGWYRTGDLALADEEGFIFIQDRLARFSKIGGEMIPHGAVEDVFLETMDSAERVLAVSSVPDSKRSERLVVLYTSAAGPVEELRRRMAAAPLPNLWKPDPEAYAQISSIPLTGTGKLDVRALRATATALFTETPPGT